MSFNHIPNLNIQYFTYWKEIVDDIFPIIEFRHGGVLMKININIYHIIINR